MFKKVLKQGVVTLTIKSFSLTPWFVFNVCINVGDFGRSHESGVFCRLALGLALSNKTLNIPEYMPLPGEEKFDISFEFSYVADEVFFLSTF